METTKIVDELILEAYDLHVHLHGPGCGTGRRGSPSTFCQAAYSLLKRAWACPHTDRPQNTQGKCKPCSNKDGKHAWACPHTNRPHAAHGKCVACAMKDREKDGKRAWACPHTDRSHDSHGKCRSCAKRHRKQLTMSEQTPR